MKVYLDLLFILNFGFDFILLLTVSIILRRNITLKRIILGSIIGAVSIFTLFMKINSLQLFLIKIIISILMILATFSYKNIKYFFKNFFFLYTISMLLGGFLYFLNVEFSYKQEGLVFYHDKLSINVVFLIILSPIILYIYIRQAMHLKNNYSNYYKVNILFHNKTIHLNGFLDTGNKLKDPYTGKPVMIVNEKIIDLKEDPYALIPITTINGKSMIKCIKVDEIEIIGIGKKKDVLLGLTKTKIEMEGIDCILQQSLLEG